MLHSSLLFSMFLIFTGASIFATIALFTRQSLLVAYIVLGWAIGPYGLAWINDPGIIGEISNIGIIFLLFLLGLNLQPQNLVHMLRSATAITIISSICFAAVGFTLAYIFGFSYIDSLVIGATMIFSSTILGLKLLPTTVLHHQRMGEVVISILLLQDLIAIVILLMLNVEPEAKMITNSLLLVVFGLPFLIFACFIIDKYILVPLVAKFDGLQEYIFLLAIGWCLGVAQLAEYFALSAEIGAFIAGVSLATSPIALYISESLKPLRDFFLTLFFFSLGATFNTLVLPEILIPSLLLALILLALKPMVFCALLRAEGSVRSSALETGFRLGQVSEFSLLIAVTASVSGTISMQASYLIQTATLISFVISSYYIVMKYPTPIALSEELRRN